MQILRVPGGEFYLAKRTNRGLGAFIFRPYATNNKTGVISKLGSVQVPKELIGKKLMFKVEIMKNKK